MIFNKKKLLKWSPKKLLLNFYTVFLTPTEKKIINDIYSHELFDFFISPFIHPNLTIQN
jgi:hypothetical protein